MERDGSGWKITAPEALAADTGSVNAVLWKVRDLRAAGFLAEDAAGVARYLAKPQVTVALWEEGAKAPKTLLVGPSAEIRGGAPAAVAALAGEGPVALVDGKTLDDLAKTADDLRDKRLLPAFELSAVKRARVMVRGKAVVVERKGETEWRVLEPTKGAARGSNVTNLLLGLKALRWKEIVAAKPGDLAPFGLDKPEAEVEVIAMAIEGLRALGLHRFQIDLGHPDFFRGLADESGVSPSGESELRTALSRKDTSTLERLVGELKIPDAVGEALLALPGLVGHEEVLDRAAAFAANARSARALANLAEVYRLLAIYGLADTVLLDLGEVRGFDYYSGMHFDTYVAGFGASLAAGGRYDHMLARFGYDCPAVGFAFDVARALDVMQAQGVPVELPGPDFFIIDFTPEKTAALSLARRLRDLGASVARDIMSRGLDASLAYARAQRVRHVLVVGSPRTAASELLALDLADGGERALPVATLLESPARFFPELGGRRDA